MITQGLTTDEAIQTKNKAELNKLDIQRNVAAAYDNSKAQDIFEAEKKIKNPKIKEPKPKIKTKKVKVKGKTTEIVKEIIKEKGLLDDYKWAPSFLKELSPLSQAGVIGGTALAAGGILGKVLSSNN